MPEEITKYIAYDGVTFNTLEEANQYETEAFNRWLDLMNYHLFVRNAGKGEAFREVILRQLFLYLKSK